MLLPLLLRRLKMKGRFCHRDNLLSLWAANNGRPSGTSTKSSLVVRVHTDHRRTPCITHSSHSFIRYNAMKYSGK